MRKKLIFMMCILGCFLLPGSCTVADQNRTDRAAIYTEKMDMAFSEAEIYDMSNGKKVLVVPFEDLVEGNNCKLNSMLRRKPRLKVVLYIH